jgi:hypothetical protein
MAQVAANHDGYPDQHARLTNFVILRIL